MELIIDTVDLNEIKEAVEYMPIVGVTSNPSIVKKTNPKDFFEHMRTIREIIGKDRSLHIQVISKDCDSMVKEAHRILEEIDRQVYIKVPVSYEGIKAIKTLKKQDVNVTATAIYSKQQGFLAMEAGADYIAPYFNRMENMGIDPDDVIASFAEMIGLYGYHTQILGASFKNAGQVDRAFLAGAQTATMDPSILSAALTQAHILKAVDDFDADWKSVYGDVTISELQ